MLGDLIDDLRVTLEQRNEIRCLHAANNTPQVRKIDEQTIDLARNWQPTGFYTPDEMTALVTKVLTMTAQARIALGSAVMSTSDAQQVVNQAHKYLTRNEERAKVYQNAIATARATGVNILDAPGLKTWVTNSMVNISQAYVTLAALDCRQTWLETWLNHALNAVNAIVDVAKRVGTLAVKLGDTVLDVGEGLFKLYPVLKWALIGTGLFVGGLAVYGGVRRYYRRQVGGVGIPALLEAP